MMIRLTYVYAMSRILDDAPVPAVLASGAGFKVMSQVEDVLEVNPNHPLGLAMDAAIDAGTIRRIGKTVGKVALRADGNNTKDRFHLAVLVWQLGFLITINMLARIRNNAPKTFQLNRVQN